MRIASRQSGLPVRLPSPGWRPGRQTSRSPLGRSDHPDHQSPAGSGRANGDGEGDSAEADSDHGRGSGRCRAFARSAADCELRDDGVPFVFDDNRRPTTSATSTRSLVRRELVPVRSFQSGIAPEHQAGNSRGSATNFTSEALVTPQLVGRGTVLSRRPAPDHRPTKGTFSGPFPPANGWNGGLHPWCPRYWAAREHSGDLDGVQLGSAYEGIPHKYWFTAAAGTTTVFAIPILEPAEVGEVLGGAPFTAITTSTALSAPWREQQLYHSGQGTATMPGPDY